MRHSINVIFKSVYATVLFVGLHLFANAQNKLSQAGYHRMQVGATEVIALSDGTVPQDLHQLLHAPATEIDALLSRSFQSNAVELSVNSYLIKTGDQLILVDAGTSDSFGPTLGHLQESLNKAGYKAEQINAVLITHIHTDHVGGLMEGNKMMFPNATIYISKPEVDFWLSAESKKKAPEGLKQFFNDAEAKVGPYLKAGKVRAFDYGQALFPGVTPVAAAGHTPGHTFYSLESNGKKLLFWGDIMHIAAVQFVKPGITIAYDIDTKAAAAQRDKAFKDAAKNGYWVAVDHLAFPGIGHLRAEGSSYVWVPLNYSTYATGQ